MAPSPSPLPKSLAPASGDLGLHPGLGTRRRRRLFALAAGLFLCPAALLPHLPGAVFCRAATVVIGLTAGGVLSLATLFLHTPGILFGGLAAVFIGLTAGGLLRGTAMVILHLAADRILGLATLLLQAPCILFGGATPVIARLPSGFVLCTATLVFQATGCFIGVPAAVTVANLVLSAATLIFQTPGGLLGLATAADIVVRRTWRRRLDHRRTVVTPALLLEPSPILLSPAAGIIRPTAILFSAFPVTPLPLPMGAVAFPFAAAAFMFPVNLPTALFPDIGVPAGTVAFHLPDQPVIVGIAEPIVAIAAATAAIARIVPDNGPGRPTAAGNGRQGGGRGGHQRHQFLPLRRGQGAGRNVRGGIAGADTPEFLDPSVGQRHVGPDVRSQGRQFQNQAQLFRRLIRCQGATGQPRIGIAHADQAQFRQAPGPGGDLTIAHLPLLNGGIDSAGAKPQKQGGGK